MTDFLSKKEPDDENWLPIADVMTGLFVIFLFIAIYAIQNASKILNPRPEPVTVTNPQQTAPVINVVEALRQAVYEALHNEFQHDLPVWRAEIDPITLAFRFKEPKVLFSAGSSQVQSRFQEILSDFFPRYLVVLNPFFADLTFPLIDEIRIEGHTSSEWKDLAGKEAFLNNMELSQNRTQAVLSYCLRLSLPLQHEQWIRSNVTSKGFSSSHLVLDDFGKENRVASRRVEFKIYLDEQRLLKKYLEIHSANLR